MWSQVANESKVENDSCLLTRKEDEVMPECG